MSKRTEKKHRVLLSSRLAGDFGDKLLVHPNARVEVCSPCEGKRLTEFDLIILPYSEFENRSKKRDTVTVHFDPQKEVFEKQMLEALGEGACFCFLHHDETVPGEIRDFTDCGYESEEAVFQCMESQAGFRWLVALEILIERASNVLLNMVIKRGEFGSFLKKWGASRHYFRTFKRGKFDDVICTSHGGIVVGFSSEVRSGLIVYLPFQANRSDVEDFRNSLLSLVDSLLTYRAKRMRELPPWARAPFFNREKELEERRISLVSELEKLDAMRAPFEEAKALLVASDYTLEKALPDFVSSRLGIPTEQNEKFAEDFWLLNDKRERLAVCEVKSVAKGFKKGAIYEVFNHRETNGLPEEFPAVLFVSCNIQAGSWAKKAVPIQASDYKIAASNNVLIVRVEDLVRIWECLGESSFSVQDVVQCFTTTNGWLECSGNKLIPHQ